VNEKRAPYRRFPSIERNRAKNLDTADHAFNLHARAPLPSNVESRRADGNIMERPSSKAVLVLDIHRSGASSMAGAMVRLGEGVLLSI
jgi:hypothetical protein